MEEIQQLQINNIRLVRSHNGKKNKKITTDRRLFR